MPSETFYCPHCNTQLTKSAQAYVLGEIMNDKNANFIGLGGPPAENVMCPACGRAIDSAGMLGGSYDSGQSGGWLAAIGGLALFWALLALGIWIFSDSSLGESAGISAFIFIGLAIFGWLVDKK